jgi:hypothetical protein
MITMNRKAYFMCFQSENETLKVLYKYKPSYVFFTQMVYINVKTLTVLTGIYYCSADDSFSSTLLFAFLPFSVRLSAIGCSCPWPIAVNLSAEMPFETR